MERRDTASRATAGVSDSERVAASLAEWVAGLAFADLTSDEVTTLLIDSVAGWASGQGWRVYRRAQSVLPLPAPYQHLRSCVDVGCARPAGSPVVVEVDRSNRRRTVDKLLAEAAAGRVAIWLRWGSGGFESPPAPVAMVTCPVVARRPARGVGGGLRYSRQEVGDRPAPMHTAPGPVAGEQTEMPLIEPPT